MSKDDKTILLIVLSASATVAALLALMTFVLVPLYNKSIQLDNEWTEKCQQAGGIPSKYRNVQGKRVDEERACFHPSALIQLKD